MSIIDLTEWEWVIVASAVTSGTIERKQTGVKYYRTEVLAGEAAPVNPVNRQVPEDSSPMFEDGSQEIIKQFPAIDIYILTAREDKKILLNGKVKVTT